MTVQLSLRKVLAKFLSDNKKDAQSGLQELRTILSDDRNLSQIDGKDWRSILEAFERAVENLKAAAANGRTTNAKASATSTVARLEKQLGECASEFRWTIERAGSNLGPALNKPVLEHILTILPYRDGLYQPIAVHYTRALRTLLAQRAYREHIPISRWHGLLKLCMRCLTAEVQSEDRRGGRRSMTLELVELSKVFYYLVIGCPDDLAAYSEDLLEFLARFIEHHPGETTCHGPLITAANHILFETAHQNLHAAQNFLESTVPFLIPLWENRSGPLRNQLILTLRFYLHIYDPTGKFAFDVKRWEANCLRLYDGIQQEFGSKFGVSPVDDLHHFVTVLRLKQKTGVLIPDTLNGHLDPASVTKWYPTYSFLDLGADVYGALLYMEANPPTHPSSDTPRARKRVKRSDVVADLTNLKKKLGNSRQKLGVLQILAFLALQTPHMLSPAQLQHLMTDFFADLMASESDVQNWALVCSTPLWSHPAAITPTFAKMAWDNTTRVVSSPSLLVDMGYHVLEAVLRAGFVPRGDVAAVVAEVGRGMRWGVSVPSAAALEFLLMSKRARGSEAMCQTLSVIDDFADSICEWVVRGRAAVPIDMIIDVLLGTPHGNTQRTDADDFPPLDLPPRDEFIGEWRLGNSRRVCRAIVEEDVEGVCGVDGHGGGGWGGVEGYLVNASAGWVEEEMRGLVEKWGEENADVGMGLVKDTVSLILVCVNMWDRAAKHTKGNASDAVVAMVKVLLQRVEKAIPACSLAAATTVVHTILLGLNELSPTTQLGCPRSAEIYQYLTRTLTPLLSRDVDSDMPPKSSSHGDLSTTTFDEFDAVEISSHSSTWTPSLVEFYVDVEAGEGEGARLKAVVVRALGVLCSLSRGTNTDAVQTAIDAVLALPLAATSPHLNLSLPHFITHISAHLTRIQLTDIVHTISDLLRSYPGEKNPWGMLAILRTLTAIEGGWIQNMEVDEEDELCAAFGMLLHFFTRLVCDGRAPWRVVRGFGEMVVVYVGVDPNENFYRKYVGAETPIPALSILWSLFKHAEFNVRQWIRRTVPQIFAIFSAQDHHVIFEDVRASLPPLFEQSFVHTVPVIATFGEIIVCSPDHRVDAALAITRIANVPKAMGWVASALGMYAKRLGLDKGSELVSDMLPELVWRWDEDVELFPVGLVGCERFEGFFGVWAGEVLGKLLYDGDVDAARGLLRERGDAGVVCRGAMVGVMARLLPDMIDSTPERFTVVNESIGFLETTIGVGVMTADMQARRAEIISEVLIHMFEPTGPAQMAGVPEMIAGNIERMKSLSGPVTGEGSATSCWSQLVSTRTVLKVIARLYPTTPDDGTACPFDTSALQIILQRAHCYIDRRRFTSDKHAFITNGYRLLIALAAPEMMHPFLFKSVLQMLLKAMKAKEMCADAGGMFCYMHLVAQRHATRLVASTITSTAPALAQLVLDYITAGHAQCAEAMERVLERVCVIARSIDQRTVQLAILQLDADMPIARRLAHRFAVDFRTADPSVVMQLMDLRDSTPFAQLARVKYLRTALDQNGLAAQLGAASGGADVNHLVGRLLAMLDTSAGNRPLIVEIGHCLGKLACFLTGRIARVDSKSELALVAAATAGDDAVKPDVGHCVALSCLQRYLFHEEFEKVDQVIRCLKRILATPAGGVAFASLRPEVAQYLDICHDSVSEVVDESSRASYPKITDNALWEALQHRSDADPTTRTVSAEQALVNLANAILSSCPTDDIFPHLRSVFEMIPELGSTMMPYILHAALHHEMTVTRKTIRKRGVVSFRAMLSKRIREIVEAPEGVEEDVLVAILRVLEFLRTQPHPLSVTPFDNNAWLDLDFVNVAKAAVHCKSYASAVLFLEIAQEVSKRPWAKELNMTQTSSGGELTACDLLFSITRSIGDADGFDGVMSYGGSRSLGDGSTSLIQKYEHDRAWDKILNLREIQLKVGAFDTPAVRAGTQVGLMKAMSNLGLHHVLATYIGGVQRAAGDKGPLDHDIRELHYESMWRNAQWGDVAGHAQGDVGIQQRLYGIMKAVHDHDAPAVEFSVSSAFYDHLKINTGNTIRSDFNPFHPLRLLVSFVEAEEVWRMASAGSASAPLELFEIWETRLENLRKTQNLADLDPILACRTTALNGIVGSGSARSTNAKAGGIMGVRPGLVRAHCSHLLSVSKIARKARNAQMAQTAMAQLEIILNEDKMKPDASDLVDIFALAKLESLKILWEQGNSALTTRSLKHYIEVQMATETQQLSKKVESQLVCQLGRWTAATRYEPPVSVMHHLATAIDLAAAANDMKLLAKAHYHLAKFADDQYQEQLLNDTSDQLEEHIRYKEREAKACEDLTKRSVGKDASNAKRYTHIRDKILLQIEMDRAEVNRFRQDRDTFLEKAVANYAQALEHGKENLDMSVFRLISLWFANIQNKEINHIIKAASRAVPSSVFLVLLYQLSARLTTSPSDDEVAFQHNLQRILLKITRDHPYHSLYHIIALKNGGQLGAPSSSRRQEESTPTIKAAEAVLQRLRRPDHLGDLVVQVDRLCNAYIELAWRKPTAAQLKESKVQQLDARLNIYAIAKSGINVPIVTSDNPVRHDCRYDDLPTIQGFKGTFWIPGGVNMPKVLDCMGTDGKKYVQLVKGNDDLRQDAVLSNIFNIMNVLFKKDLETRQRNLGIRTYKVVPLAPRVGLVEWVSNTAPIGEFLVRAHSGYHPGDWKPNECRSRMMDEHKKGSTSSKLNLYRQIEANFKPVFRHFLFENFSDPLDWFERRLAYTRSVAASSIAGYVVGLGDRHAQNILIDKGTAEVIHIDLGIAFDQGKVLTVPELVPFRLTRDIVDGMGLLGVEGAFRRGCEETMKVLRKDSQALLTILDVFRYDPLVTWTLTPLEQRRRQGLAGSEEDDRLDVLESEGPNGTTAPNTRDRGQNKEAERALFVLRKKLSASVSVECQINELIQTAMDPKNLCRMFPGWQPWM